MMDMGMYGSYGKPDSYPNYGFAGGHHQSAVGHHHHLHHHHHHVSPSPELAATAAHYYPQTTTPYSSATPEGGFLDSVTNGSGTPPQQGFYPDGTAIISTENGLSYTNLDYASVSPSSSSYGSCAEQHHQGYQQQPQQHHVVPPVYRPEELRQQHPASVHHQVGTLHIKEQPELQQHHQSSHDSSDYHSYVHQLPDDQLQQHYGQTRQDTGYAVQQQHFKEEAPDHVVYHGIQVHPHVQPQHHHHHQQHQQQHHPTQSQQQTQVPTYKWMQVKRNVPKPAGEFLSGREIASVFAPSACDGLQRRLWRTR